MTEGEELRPPRYQNIYRVNAMYSERSGWFKIHRAYVWAPTLEKAQEAAAAVFRGAKHIAVKLRPE